MRSSTLPLRRALSYLGEHLEDGICIASLSITAGSVFLQVVLRFGFEYAVPWLEETAIIGMIFAVYFGASYAVLHKAHIRIVSFIALFPRPLFIAFYVLADLLTFGYFVAMAWLTGDLAVMLSGMMQILPGLGIDQFWFQVFMPIALGLTALRMVQAHWRWMRNGFRGMPT